MDTSQNDQCSTSPLINKDCLGDEYYNSGECDNDILFVDGWEKSNDYIHATTYRKMFLLCDPASAISSNLPLSLCEQTLRVICECLHDNGMAREAVNVCEDPGTVVAGQLNIPACLKSEISDRITQTIMLYFDTYIEPFIESVNT